LLGENQANLNKKFSLCRTVIKMPTLTGFINKLEKIFALLVDHIMYEQ